jgi:hypothetical protein
MVFPGNPALSALVLAPIVMILLYVARDHMHTLLSGLTRLPSGSLRMGAKWLSSAADTMRERNKVVLISQARNAVEIEIERELERVSVTVQRDLAGYPVLQRRLLDELTRVEDDYKKCGVVPPPPADWMAATETIAEVTKSGGPLAQKILEDISTAVGPIYEKVVGEFRHQYEDRHKILSGCVPHWRSLGETLPKLENKVSNIQDSAVRLDGLMEKYEQIRKSTEKIEHSLTASASSQFVIASLVVLIALGGALVNFFLIQRPMAAMVGSGEYIFGNLEASHIGALVIILIESAMGLFLLETLRITHLFPGIHTMPDRMRVKLAWVFFTILLILAGIEVGLAVMRDQIILADLAFKRDLGLAKGKVVAEAAAELGWMQNVPVAGQMILGFILPFALAFVGLPFEYFIHSGRTVLGALIVFLLRALSFVLRISSNLLRHGGKVLSMLFDVVIFLPLGVERAIRARGAGASAAAAVRSPVRAP